MARNYQAEAASKFPAPPVPVEDDYPDDAGYQQALEAFTTQRSAVVTRRRRWIEREEAEDLRRQVEAERQAEELRKREAAELAARKRAEVVKGKRAEVSLPKRGEGSGAGRGSAVASLGVDDKDVVESYQGSERCARCVLKGKCLFSFCPYNLLIHFQ